MPSNKNDSKDSTKTRPQKKVEDLQEERMENMDGGSSSILRRLIGEGMGALKKPEEGVKNALSALTLPKDLALLFVNQADKAYQEIISRFGKEFSRFLDATDISEEIVKALSQMKVEVNAEISFKHINDKKKTDSQKKTDSKKSKNNVKLNIKYDED